MGKNKETRLRKLEQAQEPPAEEQVVVNVDWTPAGEPFERLPGVTYITWEDIGEEDSGEDKGTETQAGQT